MHIPHRLPQTVPAQGAHFTARSAAELAWAAERLGVFGAAARANGWCRGEIGPADLGFAEGSLHPVPEPAGLRGAVRRSALRRSARHHLTRGHDAACRALGLPTASIERLLRGWDGVGAAVLLLEAMDETTARITASLDRGEPWEPGEVLEILALSVRGRVTPRAP